MIWILFIATVALSLWAAARVSSVYGPHCQLPGQSGLTGAQLAAEILRRKHIYDVEITEGEGMLGDHYVSLHKRLVLSPDKFHGRTAAGWTYVAAFITSLAYFLWPLPPLLTGGRQRD